MLPNPQIDPFNAPTLAQRRAAIGRAARAHDVDAATAARRDYAEARLADYIRRTAEAFPPLTETQRAHLSALIHEIAGAA